MSFPNQSAPVLRDPLMPGRTPAKAGVRESLCVTGSCTSTQCCVSILGQSVCISNPIGISGSVQACLEGLTTVCFYINNTKIGCVSL